MGIFGSEKRDVFHVTPAQLNARPEKLPPPEDETYRRPVRDMRTMAGITRDDVPYPVTISDGPHAGNWLGWGMDRQEYDFSKMKFFTIATGPWPVRVTNWKRLDEPLFTVEHVGYFMRVAGRAREAWHELLSRRQRGRGSFSVSLSNAIPVEDLCEGDSFEGALNENGDICWTRLENKK